MLINLDKYVWLSIVIKFSYSSKVSQDLNKEITQTRKTDSEFYPPCIKRIKFTFLGGWERGSIRLTLPVEQNF